MNSSPPPITLVTMVRLGLFQLGLGMMAVLFLGVLNRVMIDSLGIPAVISSSLIAMHLFVAPARVWFGSLSDSQPMWGLHRTGYILIGSALMGLSAFGVLQAVWRLGAAIPGEWIWTPEVWIWTLMTGLGFAGYGLVLSLCATASFALLVDVSESDDRPRLISIVWSLVILGVVFGAIIVNRLLAGIEDSAALEDLMPAINQVFILIPLLVFIFACISTWKTESTYSRYQKRSVASGTEFNLLDPDLSSEGKLNGTQIISSGQVSPRKTGILQTLTQSRQTLIFFCFLLVGNISQFMHDVILEPYGALVFSMTYSETTLLNVFGGMGVLIGVGIAGFIIIPRWGKKKTILMGVIGMMCSLGLIVLSGFLSLLTLLKICVFLLPLSSGLITVGVLNLAMDLTLDHQAGTFMGTWTLSLSWARAFSTVLAGYLLSLGQHIWDAEASAFALPFGIQIVFLCLSILLAIPINISQFQTDGRRSITRALTAELEG